MLTVASKNLGDRQGVVIVQGDTMEEAQSTLARSMAIQAASSNISRPGVSGSSSAYPVDAEGKTSDDLLMGRGGAVAAYRCDYTITGGL